MTLSWRENEREGDRRDTDTEEVREVLREDSVTIEEAAETEIGIEKEIRRGSAEIERGNERTEKEIIERTREGGEIEKTEIVKFRRGEAVIRILKILLEDLKR